MIEDGAELESQIAQWRGYVRRRQAIADPDVAEMEDHLREQVTELTTAGLNADEAFLVAVKRMGNVDAISREFAREHSERLWKQLVLVPAEADEGGVRPSRELIVVLALAAAAALTFKAGWSFLGDAAMFRNASLLVLPFLAAYFVWKRQVPLRVVGAMAVPFALITLALNLYPFAADGSTQIIAALHAPLALWLVVGVAYVSGDWRSDRRRMDYIRFTGEFVVYFALIGLGGGVIMALTVGTFDALDMDVEWLIQDWVLPVGVAGALVVAAWLVEAKQNVVENIAPVLTRVFTPITAIMLLTLLGAFVVAENLVEVERDLLILLDLILVLVLGLLLYAISARDPLAAPDLFDYLQVLLVASALALDILMLAAIVTRITEFGFTPNRVAALGMNLVLLVNLAWSLRLCIAFVRRRSGFGALERWQTQYLPVYGIWAAALVLLLPPIFDFV
jgi:hypothetical protein